MAGRGSGPVASVLTAPIPLDPRDYFATTVLGMLAGFLALAGVVFLTSCGPVSGGRCAYPFAFEGLMSLYFAWLAICVGLGRPGQPIAVTASNVRQWRFAAAALAVLGTAVFIAVVA